VLVVTDEELTRWGFRGLLGELPWIEWCLSASNASDALDIATRHRADLVVLDGRVADLDLLRFTGALAVRAPNTRVLLLTDADAVSSRSLRAAGIAGHLSRRWRAPELISAMVAATGGTRDTRHEPTPASLSARQQEILELIASGATNAEIAGRLHLSPDTVKQHTSALYRKLSVHGRMHAVRAARARGLLAT
jgi:DNA-binding NarL/FixJ family response regulator